MTIPIGSDRSRGPGSPEDAAAIALAALGWVLSNDDRAQRFLDLTGLTPEGLRDAIGETSTHRAVFDFLAAYEPDLMAAADALQIAPATLISAQKDLPR